MLIFLRIALVLSGKQEIGTASAVGGLVTEAVSYLFFQRVDVANERMDRYHKERIEGQRFETLLQACDGLGSEQKREYCREQVIVAAIVRWLGTSQGTDGSDPDKSKRDESR